ncbi:hypothetical protein [Sulfobacillus harzensis]|uniref:Uncharacterized protein n=1 Tax=Sulfobacillus harzensis TaxID=2729629 RepID=A0A7Y0L645_9FIRM|nr:hypothetical protein [Sulfobacillus harzensis]NMP23743.1 hypothetical protein [Sulfobacillus harzensis]
MALLHFSDVPKFKALIRISADQQWGQVVYYQDCGYCYHTTIGSGIGLNEVAFVGTLPKTDETQELLRQLNAREMTF